MTDTTTLELVAESTTVQVVVDDVTVVVFDGDSTAVEVGEAGPRGPAGGAGFFNVQDYGAIGDGTTNDTAAIAAAVTAAAGGNVYFPPGTYAASALTISTAGTTLLGAGVTIKKNGDTGSILTIDADQVTVDGLTFDGQNSTYSSSTQDMVTLSSRSDVTFRNCRFVNGTTWGLHLYGGYRLTQRVTVRDCYFGPGSSTFTGIFANVGLEDVLINGCSFECGNAGGGITVRSYAASTTQRIRIVENTITLAGNTTTFGIAVTANDTNNVLDCVIANNTIVATASCFAAMTLTGMTAGTVVNNTFTVTGGTAATYGIELGSNYVQVFGNTFYGGGILATGIILHNATDCVIDANSIRGLNGTATARGIRLFADANGTRTTSRNTIANNHVEIPVLVSGPDAVGIEVVANAAAPTLLDANSILGNTIRSLDGSNNYGVQLTAQASVVGPVIRTLVANNTVIGPIIGFGLNYDSATKLVGNRTESVSAIIYGSSSGTGIIQEANDWQYVTAAPSSGNWFLGDKVWNSSPSTGNPMGWVCTVAGSPGTWRAMPNL